MGKFMQHLVTCKVEHLCRLHILCNFRNKSYLTHQLSFQDEYLKTKFENLFECPHVWQVAVKEVYKAKIIKKTADGKIPLEVALMQQVSQEQTKMFLHTDTQTRTQQTQAQTTDTDHTLR